MDPEIPVKPGELLAGKYHIDRVLEPGGMGVVAVATHLELRASVCLKFMLRSVATPDNVERFVREARVAAQLRGPHVCRVMDLARLPDGVPFIVMELLVGSDMAAYAKRRRRLRASEAAELVRQACDGLAEAHDAGIVHRDVKPQNLFVTKRRDGEPHVKVLDFGCSKATFVDAVHTGTAAVFGTPAYMSPEQARSTKRVDPRTDVWALGAVLYELLAGRQAFTGDTFGQILAAVERARPLPLTDAPRDLATIVARCLRKERARRYATAGELGLALGAYVAAARANTPKTLLGNAAQLAPPRTAPTARASKRTPRHITRALEVAVAAMSAPRGATLSQIQDALSAADHPHTDAKALLRWARDHRGLLYEIDLDGRVRAKPDAKT
nr:serine/threonine-protein kinase [Kofleriaceae bacterium]